MESVFKKHLAVLILSASLVGCEGTSDARFMLGAISGLGILSSGAVLAEEGVIKVPRAKLSNELQAYMDKNDQIRLANILYTKSSDTKQVWVNERSRVKFEIRPHRTFYIKANQNEPCRDFTAIVRAPEQASERLFTRACRVASGDWVSAG